MFIGESVLCLLALEIYSRQRRTLIIIFSLVDIVDLIPRFGGVPFMREKVGYDNDGKCTGVVCLEAETGTTSVE
jgi:hypothetical protein